VKTIGLCNVPINMTYDAAEKLGVDPTDIRCSFVGLNHLSVITSIKHQGEEKLEQAIQKGLEQQEGIVKNISTIETSNAFTTAFNMITSPYLQYFYYGDEMLKEEKEAVAEGKGTRAEQVMKVEETLFEIYQNTELAEKPKELEGRGGSRYSEVAIALINSIYNNKGDEHVVNVMNQGAIADLPADVVVEINCIVDSSGARPITYGHLPVAFKGLVQQVKTYEQLTIEAAIKGDYDKALLALVNNPLVAHVKQAECILNDILEQNKDYLPTFN
ncbi:MAG: 6-phospho-beta-glucosidase, partial [Cellulosilyticaceae bacterium]